MSWTIGRVNLFWSGAGFFLTLFCVNEVIAYAQAPVRAWLGGPLVLVACLIGAMIGVSVMAFLGIEEPPEEPAKKPTPAASSPDEGEPAEVDEKATTKGDEPAGDGDEEGSGEPEGKGDDKA